MPNSGYRVRPPSMKMVCPVIFAKIVCCLSSHSHESSVTKNCDLFELGLFWNRGGHRLFQRYM